MEKILLEKILAGSDFICYQECYDDPNTPDSTYKEYYYNPDCIIYYPDIKELFWFDLDHISSHFINNLNIRRFVKGMTFRRKFAISYIDNKISTSDYNINENIYFKKNKLKKQKNKEYKYFIQNEFERVVKIEKTNDINATFNQINEKWQQGKKMKIKVKIHNFILIFPIRIAFLHNNIFNFHSKMIVVPNEKQDNFSWTKNNLCYLTVSSNGEYSLLRLNEYKYGFESIFMKFFPRLGDMNKISYHIYSKSNSKLLNFIKSFLRILIFSFKKYFSSYEIHNGKFEFEILYLK